MAKRLSWPNEKLAEILEWKKANKATYSEVAAQFQLPQKKLMSALHRYIHMNGGKTPKNKKFVDLAPTPALQQVAVIICTPDQIASVVRGLQ